VDELVDRFGDEASSPVRYHEQDWSVARYSGGGMISRAPTGVLTEFGYTLREPRGRIHWAGTESSAVMCDGSTAPSAPGSGPAIRAGPRNGSCY
jgi:monoamine oxidase